MSQYAQKICMIFTGGTISMNIDEKLEAAIPALSGEQILSLISNDDHLCEVEVIDFCKIPGPHMTLDKLIELKKLIEALLMREDITGVIVTHGTDTLEEAAYFLELTLHHPKPVVMVGSMRNISELGYDGASNLEAALYTAVSDKVRNKGVLVVLSNEIHMAAEVVKTSTSSLDTFKSPYGPLGIVDAGEIFLHRNTAYRQYINTDKIEKRVDLIRAALDMDDRFIKSAVDSGAKGIVIEAMGRGNVPLQMLEGIKYAINHDSIVVIVSRCSLGRVYESYGYEGGGKELVDLGVIMGGEMKGLKARIKLILALGKTTDKKIISELFKAQDYML